MFAAIAVVAFAACEKNYNDEIALKEEKVTLQVSVPMSETKATGTLNEGKVDDYQVFVYSVNTGLLEAYSCSERSEVTISCTTGSKEIVVLANAPKLDHLVKLSDMKAARSSFADNSIGHLVMEGQKTVELTASSKVEVSLKRIVSKIRLVKVETDFEIEAYNSLKFELVSAFLINVPADKIYLSASSDPSLWYHKLDFDKSAPCYALLYDDLGNFNLEHDGEYNVSHCFYSYPNPVISDSSSSTWSPRFTRLVIEARLGGVKCYYPIPLSELKQNTAYDVSLTVKRPGTSGPNDDMQKSGVTFSIKVVDWYTGKPVTEII